ncbi:hypothetical protein SO574_08545 [Vibrio alfacsensis]|uniref:hypothetical protein n=1 Tax=Vibrio alfacsensis TaxID=1074311 RepID=UPI002ADDE6FF|nr:hypothetical protein [Vibrio alfacsensis]WQE75275.1 hypothetical protein SO574_08545 [Vibrio alfacsensis]
MALITLKINGGKPNHPHTVVFMDCPELPIMIEDWVDQDDITKLYISGPRVYGFIKNGVLHMNDKLSDVAKMIVLSAYLKDISPPIH